ncbi:AfsR/SARP family transcriptional regulator [Promicromonospora aerolata]|uniref:BTAD domain-containing putative transcriptional regulator n=1 Tax=Promicromonospora aerolata TaxID=195749 RepID=A0ABW4VDU7_9MICO
MSDLRFSVLGRMEVASGGEQVPVPPGRRRAVLACLLVHAGRPVTADALVEAAWSDDLPRDPRASLHTVVSRLRTLLGAAALTVGPGGYTLEIEGGAIDADRFAALAERARGAPPKRAADLLREALGLWRGPAYAEFADRDFAAPEAERLERLRLEVTEDRSAALLDAGASEEAVRLVEALLVDHPFRERAVQLLLTGLYRAGRQADALDRYRRHRTILAEELGLDPSPALRDLEARILGHDLLPAHGGAVPTVPAWLDTSTAFFGRDATLDDLVTAVADSRTVTVTGVGGVGKSRLVAQGLPRLVERLGLPVMVVELASVPPGRAATAVADAFGLRPRAGNVTRDLLEYLSIDRALVVLDNCEHLLEEVAEVVDAVMRRCARVRVLATSRHRLGVTSERVVPLAPFPVPATGDTTSGPGTDPAVQLFVDRVRRLRPGFELTAGNAESVAAVCRRLDGLPLALEMAASRAATLGVGDVLDGLDGSTADEPLPDLRAVVEWSVRLLSASERRLLGQLSVFVGSFVTDDVTSLTGRLSRWPEDGGVVAALGELVESHLLVREERGVAVRFRMLALVRAYADGLLTASGEADAVRCAHAEWAGERVARAARDWNSGRAVAAGESLVRAGPDLAAAVRWTLAVGRLDVAAPLVGCVRQCPHWLPGIELGDLIVEVAERCAEAGDPSLAVGTAAGALACTDRGELERARELAAAAYALSDDAGTGFLAGFANVVSEFYAGDYDAASDWLHRVAELPGLAPGLRAEPPITVALLECYHGDLATARACADAALLGAEAAGSEPARAFALYAVGEVEAKEDPRQGEVRFREAAAEAERIGSEHVHHVARLGLFAVLVRQGRHREALDLVMPLLHDLRRAAMWPQLWTTLRIAAELLAACERPRDAAFLLGAVQAADDAPQLVGDDIARYRHLADQLTTLLGATAAGRITELAVGVARAQVADWAVSVVEQTRSARTG